MQKKYWNRWENVDLQRCVRILNYVGFKGVIALDYEDGRGTASRARST